MEHTCPRICPSHAGSRSFRMSVLLLDSSPQLGVVVQQHHYAHRILFSIRGLRKRKHREPLAIWCDINVRLHLNKRSGDQTTTRGLPG